MPLLELGPWLPDMPVLGTRGCVTAKNVVPRTERSYGPMKSFGVTSGALSARCQGAGAVKALDGTIHHFAGDATKLYKLSGTTWNDASGATYTIGVDALWHGAILGNRFMMVNKNDPIQSYVIGSSSAFADLSAAAPKAGKIAIVEPGFTMVGDTVDSGDGARPNRIWWSAQEDPTSWPTPGTDAAAAVQSDYQDLAVGGGVQQVIGAVGGASCAIFMDEAIYRGDYTGDERIFAFNDIERARGTPSPGSVVNVGPFALYLGNDGFYAFDGAQSIPIGARKIDRTFFGDANDSYLERITSSVDVRQKLAFWAYASNDSTDGTSDRILIYNWDIQRWSLAEVNTEILFRSFSQGLTLEDLDALYADLEAIDPLSLDSRAFAGGRILLAGFDTAHKLGTFDGSNLAATFETTEPYTDHKRYYVDAVRPLVDGGTPTVKVGYRETPQASVSYTTGSTTADDGLCYQGISARYPRFQVTIPAGSDWTHAIGVDPMMEDDGER